jgi:eukaryotic-like serine/threonine-protein kinase
VALVITACPLCGLEYSGGEVFCPIDGARLNPQRDSADASARKSEQDPLIGATLSGRYRVLRKIGEGGMGIVYEAEHVLIEKRVALKVLREDFSNRFDVVERFRQEARSASKIGHENIIDISDFGVTGGGANFFVMELLAGRDLAEELGRHGPLSPRRSLHILLQCARALGAAHAKGIVHRDMKPENIFLVERANEEDFVKIVDFGIAKISDLETAGLPGRKLTKTGMIFGTPEYMSPEQASGKPLDQRVDVYALGIILYELLVGRVPFMGDTFMAILTQHAFEEVPPLTHFNPRCNAPPEVERIVFRALAKQPDDRYPNMEELAADLAGALTRTPSSLSSLAPPPGTITHYGNGQEPRGAPRAPRLLASVPATDFPSAGSSRGRFWPIAAALGVVGAGAAAFVLHERPPPAAPAIVAPPAEPAALPTSAPAAAPAAPAPAPPPPAAAQVLVDIRTDPPGAAISVDGKPGCAPTPCSISAQRDAILQLQAELPGHRASRTELRADADRKELSLVLKKRVTAPRGEASAAEGELLIPDAFARPRRAR